MDEIPKAGRFLKIFSWKEGQVLQPWSKWVKAWEGEGDASRGVKSKQQVIPLMVFITLLYRLLVGFKGPRTG